MRKNRRSQGRQSTEVFCVLPWGCKVGHERYFSINLLRSARAWGQLDPMNRLMGNVIKCLTDSKIRENFQTIELERKKNLSKRRRVIRCMPILSVAFNTRIESYSMGILSFLNFLFFYFETIGDLQLWEIVQRDQIWPVSPSGCVLQDYCAVLRGLCSGLELTPVLSRKVKAFTGSRNRS